MLLFIWRIKYRLYYGEGFDKARGYKRAAAFFNECGFDVKRSSTLGSSQNDLLSLLSQSSTGAVSQDITIVEKLLSWAGLILVRVLRLFKGNYFRKLRLISDRVA